MKKRLWLAAVIAVMMVMILSATALALKPPASGTAGAHGQAGTRSQAKQYEIAFGAEPYLEGNATWPVYSAPTLRAYRAANGRASVHMEDDVYSGGWLGSWLLIRYPKVNGGQRVGWVPKAEINRPIKRTKECNFAFWPVKVKQDCIMTDDPLYESEILAYASRGEELTYLGYYPYNRSCEYAYVQGEMDGEQVCGFIPFDAIDW